eukprot:2087709-Rhodomonas_salina.2
MRSALSISRACSCSYEHTPSQYHAPPSSYKHTRSQYRKDQLQYRALLVPFACASPHPSSSSPPPSAPPASVPPPPSSASSPPPSPPPSASPPPSSSAPSRPASRCTVQTPFAAPATHARDSALHTAEHVILGLIPASPDISIAHHRGHACVEHDVRLASQVD